MPSALPSSHIEGLGPHPISPGLVEHFTAAQSWHNWSGLRPGPKDKLIHLSIESRNVNDIAAA